MLAAQRRYGSFGNAFEDASVASAPEGLVQQEMCTLSGMPANPWCPSRRRERVPAGDRPPCSWHHQTETGVIVVWPREYQQWAQQNGLVDRPAVPVQRAEARHVLDDGPHAPLTIANPPTGATYLIDPTLRREFQTLSLRAVASTPGPLEWLVDGQRLATSSSDAAVEWPLTPGVHTIGVRDREGHSAEAQVVVR
jgi:membrane carboxypeptidase/penicillin-binding protein PbpC